MVGMFVWNDVDMLFILNFDLNLKLILFQGHKRHIFQHHAIDGCHFKLSLSILKKIEWNFAIYE